jgi:hypothetical protein
MLGYQSPRVVERMGNAGIRPLESLSVPDARKQLEDLVHARTTNPLPMASVSDVAMPVSDCGSIPVSL